MSEGQRLGPSNFFSMPVADLHSKVLDAPPVPNSLNFMQFLGKFGKIICWHPLGGWRRYLEEFPVPKLNAVDFWAKWEK